MSDDVWHSLIWGTVLALCIAAVSWGGVQCQASANETFQKCVAAGQHPRDCESRHNH